MDAMLARNRLGPYDALVHRVTTDKTMEWTRLVRNRSGCHWNLTLLCRRRRMLRCLLASFANDHRVNRLLRLGRLLQYSEPFPFHHRSKDGALSKRPFSFTGPCTFRWYDYYLRTYLLTTTSSKSYVCAARSPTVTDFHPKIT